MDKATIMAALVRNPAAVEKAIVLLYRLQTADEQTTQSTKHTNGQGFSMTHAATGAYYAKWILGGKHLTGKHLVKAREITMHYAGTQLLRAAYDKEASILKQVLAKRDLFNMTTGVGFLAD